MALTDFGMLLLMVYCKISTPYVMIVFDGSEKGYEVNFVSSLLQSRSFVLLNKLGKWLQIFTDSANQMIYSLLPTPSFHVGAS